MRIFIAGASGLVGGNCMNYFAAQPGSEVVGTHYTFSTPDTVYFDTLNLDNPDNFDVESFKPTHILHAGALTHVDLCEDEPERSYRETVQSTLNMVQLAKTLNAQLIYVSTDYIFDGKNGPYGEEEKTNPLSIYGKHKLEAERIIQNELDKWLIIRITNVYGEEIRGKNFISRLIKACIEKEKLSLKLPVDQFATPINALNVAEALWLLMSDGKNGIYHLAGTDYLNRVQLAYKVINYFPSNNIVLLPFHTQQLGQKAERPLSGGLKCIKFLMEYPHFQFSSADNYMNKYVKNLMEKL